MFLSTMTNNLDAKGRVSVPADFRAEASLSAFDGVILWPGFSGPYLEGGGLALVQSYQRSLELMDPYDPARLALEDAVFAESFKLPFDGTGRVSLPKGLTEYAGLNGKVMFVGRGQNFQIWNPQIRQAHKEDVRRLARENMHLLRSVPSGHGSSGTSGGAL